MILFTFPALVKNLHLPPSQTKTIKTSLIKFSPVKKSKLYPTTFKTNRK